MCWPAALVNGRSVVWLCLWLECHPPIKLNSLVESVSVLCSCKTCMSQPPKQEFLLPLDAGRWLGADVVEHAIDALD